MKLATITTLSLITGILLLMFSLWTAKQIAAFKVKQEAIVQTDLLRFEASQ